MKESLRANRNVEATTCSGQSLQIGSHVLPLRVGVFQCAVTWARREVNC